MAQRASSVSVGVGHSSDPFEEIVLEVTAGDTERAEQIVGEIRQLGCTGAAWYSTLPIPMW